jgi:hypothetical protein
MSRRTQKPPVGGKISNASLPVANGATNNLTGIHRANSVTGSELIQSSVVEDMSLRNQNKSENQAPYGFA